MTTHQRSLSADKSNTSRSLVLNGARLLIALAIGLAIANLVRPPLPTDGQSADLVSPSILFVGLLAGWWLSATLVEHLIIPFLPRR